LHIKQLNLQQVGFNAISKTVVLFFLAEIFRSFIAEAFG